MIEASLAALDKYHPGWDQWSVEELNDPETINRETIMIPPSFDMLKRFFGPTEHDADGVNLELVTSSFKGRIAGDRGEEKLFTAIADLKLGGIFIGGLSISHILARRALFAMPDGDPSLERRLENDSELFACVCSALQNAADGIKLPDVQEMDGIFLHPLLGVCLIEVKNKKAMLRLDDADNLTLEKKFADAMQLEKYECVIARLLSAISQVEATTSSSDTIDVTKIAYLAGGDLLKKRDNERLRTSKRNLLHELQSISATCDVLIDEIVDDQEKLLAFFVQKISSKVGVQVNRFEEDATFRALIAILVGSRPDMFISPVRCVMQLQHLIDTSTIGLVNYSQGARLRTSLHNKSLTAEALLQAHFPYLPEQRVIFVDCNDVPRTVIYFTEKQTKAIVNAKTYPIIRGTPGSGKSLVQMMRIFIALQQSSSMDCIIASAHHHMQDYFAFLRANHKSFKRDWSVFFHRGDAFVKRLKRRAYEYFVDEVSPDEFREHFEQENPFDGISLVLSSIRANEHCRLDTQFVIDLSTHFRGTESIANYWRQYYARNEVADVGNFVIGHHFTGIPPEHYRFEHVHDGMRLIEHRIATLVQNDARTTLDFAIYFATYAELFTFASFTRLFELLAKFYYDRDDGRFAFYFRRPMSTSGATIRIETDDADMNRILQTWTSAFDVWFRSIEHDLYEEDKDAKALFDGFSLLALEARSLPFVSDELRARIDDLFASFIAKLNARTNVDQRTLGYEDSERVERMTSPEFDPFTFASYLDVHTASVDMQSHVVNAVCYLQEIAFERGDLRAALLEHFKSFRLVNTWPRLLCFEEIASIEMPIVIVFMPAPAAIAHAQLSFNYSDVMSLIFSRAQSHLIICEWDYKFDSSEEREDSGDVEDDLTFSNTVLNALTNASSRNSPVDFAVANFYSSIIDLC